jgi:hypothetical protein
MADSIREKVKSRRYPDVQESSQGRLLYTHPSFEGMIPVGAVGSVLSLSTDESDIPDYLGKISILSEPELVYYYIKPYHFEGETVVFDSLNIDPNKDYYFFTCSVRLRRDFEFLAYDYEDGELTKMAYVPTGDRLIFCELLLNIHEYEDDSLAAHTFLFPNQHLKTSKLDEMAKKELAKLRGEKSFTNDTTGCDTMVGVHDRLPIFRRKGQTKDDLGGRFLNRKEEYMLLTRGTDNTLSYCAGHSKEQSEAPLPNNILQSIEMASRHRTFDKKLGIANQLVKKYTAGRFVDRFGLHILEEDAWLIGHFDIISYA